jgi:hypothetical protein
MTEDEEKRRVNAFGFEVEAPAKPCKHIEALRRYMRTEQLCVDIVWDYSSVGILCKRCAITVSCDDDSASITGESQWP